LHRPELGREVLGVEAVATSEILELVMLDAVGGGLPPRERAELLAASVADVVLDAVYLASAPPSSGPDLARG
jgi:hypothetical protein